MDYPNLRCSRRQLLTRTLLGAALSSAATIKPFTALAAADSTDLWQQTSAQWVINPRLAYFDTAQFAPGIRATLAADFRANESLHNDPSGYFREQFGTTRMQTLCTRMGRWLECSADEVSFCRSAVQALQTLSFYWPLQSGDEVVIHAQLPSALRLYWSEQALSRGLVIKTVDLPAPLSSQSEVVAAFDNAMTERTRVVMLSQVQELDGAVLPVRDISTLAHARGALCMVDGSYGLGALSARLPELDCDVYAASLGHWLSGSAASGVLYVRRSLHERFSSELRAPSLAGIDPQGWPALVSRWHDFSTLSVTLPGLPLLLDFQDRLGRDRIEARLRALHTYARLRLQANTELQLLTPNQPGMALNILSLRSTRRSGAQMAEWLRANDNVITSGFERNPNAPAALADMLRISFNIYNSHDDIDRLVQGLTRAARV